MKRNEMVDKIVETIQMSCGSQEGELLYPPEEYLAEVILRTIEDNGMQPPKIQQYILPDGKVEFAYTEWVNKWES